MKQIKKFGIIALFAVVAFGLASCKNEDDNSSSGDTTPPADVTNLSVDKIDGKYILSWTDATDSDIFGYEITYSELPETEARTIAPMESGSIFVAQGTQRCEMSPLDTGKVFNFTVKTMDLSGNKSAGVSFKTTVLTKEECQLWTQVFYNNVQYDVVKNSFITTTATEPTEAQKAKLSPRYDRNDALIYEKVKEFLNIDNCIILLDKKEEIGSDLSSRSDKYKVLSEDLKEIATVKFQYEYTYMPAGSMTDIVAFYNLSAKDLRKNYDAGRIFIRNEAGDYGTDYSKKKELYIRYARNEDGSTNFDVITKEDRRENSVELAPGIVKYPVYEAISYNADGTEKDRCYAVQELLKGNSVSQVYIKTNNIGNYIRAIGSGKINESPNSKDYGSYVFLQRVDNSSIRFNVELRRTVSGTERRQIYNVTYNYKTDQVTSFTKQNRTGNTYEKEIPIISDSKTWEEFSAMLDDFVTEDDHIYEEISLKGTIVLGDDKNSDGMPKTIMLTAPFRDRNAPYQKYATATFNLSETETYPNSNIPLYVADVEGFLDKYRADYLKLYQDYKAANP